jgi:hypothetical protein
VHTRSVSERAVGSATLRYFKGDASAVYARLDAGSRRFCPHGDRPERYPAISVGIPEQHFWPARHKYGLATTSFRSGACKLRINQEQP